jgi:hypothetical protein
MLLVLASFLLLIRRFASVTGGRFDSELVFDRWCARHDTCV